MTRVFIAQWRLDAVAAAESQIGVCEATNHNDGVPAQRYCTMSNGAVRNEPWCAYFVRWCYARGGIVIPGNEWELASVQYVEDRCREAGRLRGRSEMPNTGDIVFYGKRGASDSGPGRHCGIVVNCLCDVVRTVEGNVRHAVRYQAHNAWSPRVVNYGWF